MKFDTEYKLKEFRKKQNDVFDECGHIYPNLPSLPFIMADMLDLINIMEKDLKEISETNDFEKVVRPVIKYLCENHHPHMTIIITSTNAELVEGLKSTGEILDYLRD